MQTFNPPLTVKLLFAADLLLAALHLTYFLLGAPFEPLVRIVNLDSETSVATWYATAKHLLVALTGLPVCLYLFKQKHRHAKLFTLLSLVFLLFSLDEIVVLHESLGTLSDQLLPGGTRQATPFWQTGIWVFVIGLPVLAGLSALVYSLSRTLREVDGVLSKLVLGISIFLLGALGFELLSNFTADASIARQVEVMFEELFEMLGVTLVFWAFYDYLVGLGFAWYIGESDGSAGTTNGK